MKDTKIKETNLAKPVADWLRSRDCTVYSEIPFYTRCLDMVGLNPTEVIVVELKLSLSKKVINQAVIAHLATNDVYVGISTNPRPKSIELCRKYHVGILAIREGKVSELLKPNQAGQIWDSARQHLRDNALSAGPSDIAGLPMMSGCGPAQAVGEMVREYVSKNRKANWREIFENVPNHYSNYKSMCCAMNGYLGLSLRILKNQVNPQCHLNE